MTYGENGEKEYNMERTATVGFMRAMKEIMQINPSMPAAQIYVLALVSLNEGKSLTELCQVSGIRHATLSRYLLDLSDKRRTGDGHGFKLINREVDPMELRKNMYTLAPKGRHLFRTITSYFQPQKGTSIVDIPGS
jgi:DNA-binding MarR family transcriptional regulator